MLPENIRVKNVTTLVKFRVNHDNPRSRNRIITNTLGKVGFINQLYRGIIPNDEEFWMVRIDSMITRGTPVSGVFILTPLNKIERDDVEYILPGMFICEDDDGIRYVKPKIPHGYWLMAIKDRRPLREPSIHAIIVLSAEPPTDVIKQQSGFNLHNYADDLEIADFETTEG